MGRSTYTYTPAGKVATCLVENSSNGTWVNYYRLAYTYDVNNYQLTFLEEFWVAANNQWGTALMSTNDNNSNGTVHQSVSQYRDSTSAPWANTGRATYAYLNPTGIATVQNNSIQLFPNPCTGSINVHQEDMQPATATVIDNSGRVVLTTAVAGNESAINISKLPEGTYTLLLSTHEGQKTAHFVKR